MSLNVSSFAMQRPSNRVRGTQRDHCGVLVCHTSVLHTFLKPKWGIAQTTLTPTPTSTDLRRSERSFWVLRVVAFFLPRAVSVNFRRSMEEMCRVFNTQEPTTNQRVHVWVCVHAWYVRACVCLVTFWHTPRSCSPNAFDSVGQVLSVAIHSLISGSSAAAEGQIRAGADTLKAGSH